MPRECRHRRKPGTSGPRGGTSLAGYSYVTENGIGSGAVAYIDENNEIEVLILSGGVWNYANLTAITKAPNPQFYRRRDADL